MRKTKSVVLVILLALAILSTAIPIIPTASAATAHTEINGTLNGANYTLWMPDPITAWTGGLVIYCHGYSHTESTRPLIKASDGTSNWANGMISVGSAFAISSWGAGGYCLQKAMNATYELTQYLVSTYNVRVVLLMGLSMGSSVALLLGEKYPTVYSGVLDISGGKNITDQYNGFSFVANANDTALTARLQALTAKVPPFPFSLYPPPLSNQLATYRNFSAQAVIDIEAECGGTPVAVPQNYQNDPVHHANISIPVIEVHGTSDAIVPYSQSLQYQAAVAAAGKSSLYRLYSVVGGEHVDPTVQSVASSHFTELVSLAIAQLGRQIVQASAFCNVTVLPGWTWYFFAQGTGGVGTLSYQWFEGSTLLQGQTSMVLAVTKNTPGTYAYYCKVTDSDGTSANSNAVYLAVL